MLRICDDVECSTLTLGADRPGPPAAAGSGALPARPPVPPRGRRQRRRTRFRGEVASPGSVLGPAPYPSGVATVADRALRRRPRGGRSCSGPARRRRRPRRRAGRHSTGPTVIGTATAGKRADRPQRRRGAGSGAIVYRFQWDRCNAAGADCLSIVGATSPTYTLVARDVGKTLGLTVVATDSTGTASAYVEPRRPDRAAAAAARVDRPARRQRAPPVVGKADQVTHGDVEPDGRPTFTYPWERCNANGRACAPIASANREHLHGRRAPTSVTRCSRSCRRRTATTIQNAFSTATPAGRRRLGARARARSPRRGDGHRRSTGQLIAATGIWQGVGSVCFAFRGTAATPSAATAR